MFFHRWFNFLLHPVCYELSQEVVKLKAPDCAGIAMRDRHHCSLSATLGGTESVLRKREPENKVNPSSSLTRASAHIHSNTAVTVGTRGGLLKSYDSGKLLSWGQRKHPPLLGPLTQLTLRGLFSILLSS